eukprot:3935247-Rhodomonas_salina.2
MRCPLLSACTTASLSARLKYHVVLLPGDNAVLGPKLLQRYGRTRYLSAEAPDILSLALSRRTLLRSIQY